MDPVFVLTSMVVLSSAWAAVFFRRPVHSVLCLTLSFAGVAAFFLRLGAEFAGFAQIMVYVGAISILIVFALLLTQNGGAQPEIQRASGSPVWGMGLAALVFGALSICIQSSSMQPTGSGFKTPAVRQIGEALMTDYVLPLEVLGLLLTAALVGAVMIALNSSTSKTDGGGGE
jgi:NADH-quinone oxidoreductase subunit J